MNDVIRTQKLHYTYIQGKTSVEALKGVDLSVKRGEIFGFLGPNGAGKTTTIKLLLGMIRPLKGSLEVLGSDPRRPETRISIGYMPEIADYYRYLTPVELLTMYGDIFGIPAEHLSERIDELLNVVDIAYARGRIMNTFSKGMMQKVSFAQALINDPDLLILDEPTSGLDPVARKKMRDAIKAQREKGKTVFFSSHELSEVELVCDRVGILNKGNLITSGHTDEFLSEKGEKQSLESYFLQTIGEAA